eukprot:9733366-Karenia_brevis.AAC.1
MTFYTDTLREKARGMQQDSHKSNLLRAPAVRTTLSDAGSAQSIIDRQMRGSPWCDSSPA